MKIRIFKKLVDGIFDVRVQTEDWSENDKSLMVRYGEPEINLGGTFQPSGSSDESSSEDPEYTVPDCYVRIMSESPFVCKFDSRDIGSVDVAKEIADEWSSHVENGIIQKVSELRSKNEFFATEEITEY